jgi:hypothetical protein
MNRMFLVSRLLLLATLLTTPLAAQTLSGRVVSPASAPIAGIAVDAGNGSTPATTDALGSFTIAGLQVGSDYDVEFVPPIGAPWAARIVTVVITGATNIGDVVLPPGFAISGTATDAAGTPLASCNINVYEQSGAKLFTPRDGTDAAGAFSVVVPAGTWDVRVLPPVGALLVPRQVENVVVGPAVHLGTVTLPVAHLVTGSVVDQVTSVPIAQARLKIYNALTGERIHVPNDLTNLFGQFSLPLPWGLADLDIEPPVGNTHVARRLYGVPVPGPVALGPVRLQNGALLSGTVFAAGLPVAGADIDVLLPDGDKVFTPRDTTSSAGTFAVAVPIGVPLRTRIEAPAGTTLYGTVTAPVTFTAGTSLGAIHLAAGMAVSGTVTGVGGPEPAASLRFFDAATNVQVVTTSSVTDATGQYTTHVPPGTYRVFARTVEGSTRAPAEQIVTIPAPATVDFILADKLARLALWSFGTPTLPQNGFLPVNAMLHSMVPGTQSILIDLAVELPSGVRVPVANGLWVDLPNIAFQVDFVWLPVPPVPAAYVGRVIDYVVTLRDASGLLLLDEAKTPFVVE